MTVTSTVLDKHLWMESFSIAVNCIFVCTQEDEDQEEDDDDDEDDSDDDLDDVDTDPLLAELENENGGEEEEEEEEEDGEHDFSPSDDEEVARLLEEGEEDDDDEDDDDSDDNEDVELILENSEYQCHFLVSCCRHVHTIILICVVNIRSNGGDQRQLVLFWDHYWENVCLSV